MLEAMVKELRNTSRRNMKIDILKRYFDADPEIKKVLQRTYNPFEKFYVTTISTTVSGPKNISDNYDQLHKILDQISSRQVTGNLAREIVLRYVNGLTVESQQIFVNILNKDLKCGIGPESINAACKGLIEQFSVQLANKYQIDRDYKVDFWYGSHKFDGIRCIYQGRSPDCIRTREGHELAGFPNIIADLQTLLDRIKAQPEFADVDPSQIFVDGELFSDSLDFNTIQGIVLSKKNTNPAEKRKIYLKVFAIGPVKTTPEMIKFFDDPKIFEGLVSIKPITYVIVNNDPETIMRITREYVDQGYEGLMLRHPINAYDWKRSNNLVKSKLHHDTVAELVIVGYKAGRPRTKYEHTFGSFTCRGTVENPYFTDGKKWKGTYEVECEVGSGFSDEERKEIWEDPEAYIGKEIVINYQCMSKSTNSDTYSLRFGIKKKGFKLDRTSEF